MAKGKDLTNVAFDELSVGSLTWFPRSDNNEGHKRGIITEKGNNSILVQQHYWNYLNDPTVEKALYILDDGKLSQKDTYNKTSEFEKGAKYREIANQLKSKGVKLKK